MVATEKTTGKRMSFVFNSDFDMTSAASDFELRYEQLSLEAMIPGDHKEVYIRPMVDTHRKIPLNQLFSGF